MVIVWLKFRSQVERSPVNWALIWLKIVDVILSFSDILNDEMFLVKMIS